MVIFFVELACGELDLVATYGGPVYVRASVRPNLSRPYFAHSVKGYKLLIFGTNVYHDGCRAEHLGLQLKGQGHTKGSGENMYPEQVSTKDNNTSAKPDSII